MFRCAEFEQRVMPSAWPQSFRDIPSCGSATQWHQMRTPPTRASLLFKFFEQSHTVREGAPKCLVAFSQAAPVVRVNAIIAVRCL